jgi:hypothetical protein
MHVLRRREKRWNEQRCFPQLGNHTKPALRAFVSSPNVCPPVVRPSPVSIWMRYLRRANGQMHRTAWLGRRGKGHGAAGAVARNRNPQGDVLPVPLPTTFCMYVLPPPEASSSSALPLPSFSSTSTVPVFLVCNSASSPVASSLAPPEAASSHQVHQQQAVLPQPPRGTWWMPR